MKYNYRYLARFVIEAATPLSVGSGEGNICTDALVALDANGLPYIPGSSLAGAIRNFVSQQLDVMQVQSLFGYQSSEKPDEGQGSEIIFTDAKIMGKEGKVIDGLDLIDFSDDFYRHFTLLPIRQHVRIGHQGAAQNGGKFDEQVVFKGTRFCFEIEMLYDGSKEKEEVFETVLTSLGKRSFRIGGGSRKGFGKIEVISVATCKLDLNNSEDVSSYLDKSSGLSQGASWWVNKEAHKNTGQGEDGLYDVYRLELKPDSFFLFGSGMGDSEADMTPVKGTYIDWTTGLPEFKTEAVLIPASSVKGALAHRVAFYYNQLKKRFADSSDIDISQCVGSNNEAVKTLFGFAGNIGGSYKQIPGNILMSDVIVDRAYTDKLLNHVSIDRFTGGAIEGALFAEKATYDQGSSPYKMEFLVKKRNYEIDILEALKKALLDICNGMLPLGGGVNRGHGCFKGSLFINDNKVYDGNC